MYACRVPHISSTASIPSHPQAPPARDAAIEAMVSHTSALAQAMLARKLPVLVFLDTQEADKPEPPYPPHCIRGTGEEKLVPGGWMTWTCMRAWHTPCACVHVRVRVQSNDEPFMRLNVKIQRLNNASHECVRISTSMQIALRIRSLDALSLCPSLPIPPSSLPSPPLPPSPPPALSWLESRQGEGAVTLMEKDCIDGFVGGMRGDGSNVVVDWVKKELLDDVRAAM